MSYDMGICNEGFNLTYNVAPMLYKHNEEGIRFIYGKTGLEASVLLIDMYNFFLQNHEELEKMNPGNGWGSWENTVNFLNKAILTSIKHPDDIWDGD